MGDTTSMERSEEGRAFLQHRVARAGLAGALGFASFLLFRIVLGAITGDEGLLRPDMTFHGVAVLPLLLMWIICRRGTRSPAAIRTVEAAGMLGTTVATAAMGHYIPLWNQPAMIVFSALSFGWTARAIYVPSSGWRTFVLTAIGGAPLLAGTYLHHLQFDPTAWSSLVPDLAGVTPTRVAAVTTVNMLAWWSLTVGLCTAASNVIYGLRRDIREARRLGQYTLEEKLGEGGMGMVYRARHAMLRRPTAIKLLLPERVGTASLARFEREVQLTAELTHPNTIRIHDYGRTSDGTLYYVMELLKGADLARIVATSGPQPPARVVHVLVQVAGALREAHELGLVHRDIKPSNIMLCDQGGVPDLAKVLDFGLVLPTASALAPHLSEDGQILGTPRFMSPEQAMGGRQLDERSDIYSLGAVAYYLLTGRPPFDMGDGLGVMIAHVHDPVVPPSLVQAGIPADLEAVVLRCLAKEPADRYPDAESLEQALGQCACSGDWDQRRASRWVAEEDSRSRERASAGGFARSRA